MPQSTIIAAGNSLTVSENCLTRTCAAYRPWECQKWRNLVGDRPKNL